MKKLSVFVSLSLMLASISWAEKYEYVRLKTKETGFEIFTYDSKTYYIHDSVTLQSGDVAKIVAITKYGGEQIFFDDGEDIFSYYIPNSGEINQNIVGPGTIYLAKSSTSFNPCLITLAIQRASDTGSKTLSWNGSEWEGSDDSQLADNNSNNSSLVPDPNGIKYDQLLGWCYFTDTPWLYSYTNGSWYYLHSLPDGIYVWNANLPDNGWVKLYG